MKLKLQNFGCWKNNTFEFPDSGIILLSSPSGKGKTTILRAIFYALTGQGTKLPTFGEVKCVVELEYQDLYILRCNRPGKLLVKYNNQEYEKDEAQSLINSLLGNIDNSYIQQKSTNSFFSLTPLEKLKYLEKLAMKKDIESLKENLKEKINTCDREISRLQGCLSGLKAIPRPTPPEVPISGNKKEVSSKLEEYKTSLLSLQEKEKEAIRKEEEQRQIEDKISLLTSSRNKILESIASFEKEKESLSKKILIIEEEKEEIPLSEIQKAKEEVDTFNEYIRLTNSQISKEDKMNNWYTKRIEELNTQIQENKYTKEEIEELNTLPQWKKDLKEYRYQQDIKKKREENTYSFEEIVTLTSSIEETSSLLSNLKLSKGIHKCPSCSSSLFFNSGKLEIRNTSLEYSLSKERELTQTLDSLSSRKATLLSKKKVFDSLPSISSPIEMNEKEIEEYIHSLEIKKHDYEVYLLNSEKLKSKRDTLISESKQLKEEIDKIRENRERTKFMVVTSNLNLETGKLYQEEKYLSLLKKKNEIEKHNQSVQASRKFNASIHSSMKTIQDNIDKYHTQEKEITSSLLSLSSSRKELPPLSDLQKEITQVSNLIQECDKTLTSLSKYSMNIKEYNSYITSKKEYTSSLNSFLNKFTSYQKFKEYLLQAEMLSLTKLIDEINTSLQTYLDLFFVDTPISVEIALFKENTAKKVVTSQVNINVMYKGNEVSLNTLSGGEQDRINLALTLALNEDSPLLMLDETLSSLDVENSENVLDILIQNKSKDKCILVICHQISTGLFDHVIEF